MIPQNPPSDKTLLGLLLCSQDPPSNEVHNLLCCLGVGNDYPFSIITQHPSLHNRFLFKIG